MAKEKTYSEKLRDPRWQKKRLDILSRDKFTCKLCKDKTTELHIHHFKYNGNPWESENSDLITYCKHCHLVVENLKGEKIKIVKVVKYPQQNDSFFVVIKDESDNIHFCDITDGAIDSHFNCPKEFLTTIIKGIK